ncbi:MAG: N-acetyl-gamma-glutamyl-phosphate reductase [Phaeodactylibacter sp.]|nr:N-acetyl-gamma-glutamyl-phosphate reductase [Phaeodactylibacter sp.]
MQKKQIAIIGATGFTGSELVRILRHHPAVDIAAITSESRAGEPFSQVHPFFEGIVDAELIPVADLDTRQIDLVFLALPHGVSMRYVEQFQEANFPIIDLSGDFRLSSPAVYDQWYKKAHSYPTGFERSAYGIPELYPEAIRQSRLIANPGCYPTSVLLGVAPLLNAGLIKPRPIIADCKSGVTGAGVKSKPVNHFSTVNDNFKAYGLKGHRHTIEIQEQLQQFSGRPVTVQFTPHLLPVDRGILSTIYLQPEQETLRDEDLKAVYRQFYSNAPFIRLRETPPASKQVRGTNYCDIFATYDRRTGNLIVITAIDNLVKGAAGQAVQNMNLHFNWDQQLGLEQIPLCP